MWLTSRQRRVLAEADMSRRDFLKLTGKAAAGAAAPQSMLKGLLGTPGAQSATASAIPANPVQALAVLLKWAKDSGNYKKWYNDHVKYYTGMGNDQRQRAQAGIAPMTKDEMHQNAIDRINEWAEWNVQSVVPDSESETTSAMDWILWDGTISGASDALPGWMPRYRLAQWTGKDPGPNHPFVKDINKWYDLHHRILDGSADKKVTDEFFNILKNTVNPKQLSQAMSDYNLTINATGHQGADEYFDQDAGDTDIEPEEKPEEEQKPEETRIPTDEPDSWRTQSVEFESRLRRLVR